MISDVRERGVLHLVYPSDFMEKMTRPRITSRFEFVQKANLCTRSPIWENEIMLVPDDTSLRQRLRIPRPTDRFFSRGPSTPPACLIRPTPQHTPQLSRAISVRLHPGNES